jgi:hypothetical protein
MHLLTSDPSREKAEAAQLMIQAMNGFSPPPLSTPPLTDLVIFINKTLHLSKLQFVHLPNRAATLLPNPTGGRSKKYIYYVTKEKQTCNPTQKEDCCLKPAWTNSWQDPSSKIPNPKKVLADWLKW